MGKVENSAELLKAQACIWNQTLMFKNSASIKCAVQLGIPDVIHEHGKPMTLSELTAALAIKPSKARFIDRLMRVLVHTGFFAEERLGHGSHDQDAYALTLAGRLLVKDETFNERGSVLMTLDPVMVKPWFTLGEWFQNDDPSPFHTAHGKSFWEHTAEEPGFGKLFDEVMANDSQFIKHVLINDYKFVFEGLISLVDVGGGTGTVARAIAETFPKLKCTVYDLPQVVANLQGSENFEFVAGDMFKEIPTANAILLKWILHDWNDEDCLKILKNCKKAIPGKDKGGKVIIIEAIMESQKQDNESIETEIGENMQMMVMFGSKERTEKEWAALFQDAGFSGYKLTPMVGLRSLIEVYP
uniref:Rankinidine/humantenine-11-O-methyltransferase n=1 Tax=Gelsemium sempervirens TaxID=28542 RepID=A0A346A6F6_GELSE|nr:rankinidine/humantenine-11-O-methyltransferase [Gelsemium sempervirens]